MAPSMPASCLSACEVITVMAREFDSLPPDIIFEIARSEALDRASLFSLIRTSKFLHALLWRFLYQREVASFIRFIRTGSVAEVSKFIAAGVNLNLKWSLAEDVKGLQTYAHRVAMAVVSGHEDTAHRLAGEGAGGASIIKDILYCRLLAAAHPMAATVINFAGTGPSLDHDEFSMRLAWLLKYSSLKDTTTPVEAGCTAEDLAAVLLGRSELAALFVQSVERCPSSVGPASAGATYTPLELAALCLQPAVVRQLLEGGADPNLQAPPSECTVLHLVLDSYDMLDSLAWLDDGQQRLVDVITLLLEHGADPSIERRCPVHSSDGGGPWQCSPRCRLTSCSMGLQSSFVRVREIFLGACSPAAAYKAGVRGKQEQRIMDLGARTYRGSGPFVCGTG